MSNLEFRTSQLDADEPWAVQIKFCELRSLVAIDLASERSIAAVSAPTPPSVQDYVALIAELPPKLGNAPAGSLSGLIVLKPDLVTTDPRIAAICRVLGIARIFQGAARTEAERLAVAVPGSEAEGIAM